MYSYHIELVDFTVLLTTSSKKWEEKGYGRVDGTKMVGEMIACENKTILIFVDVAFLKKLCLDPRTTLVHEVSHAATYILEVIGSECSELRALLVENLYKHLKVYLKIK